MSRSDSLASVRQSASGASCLPLSPPKGLFAACQRHPLRAGTRISLTQGPLGIESWIQRPKPLLFGWSSLSEGGSSVNIQPQDFALVGCAPLVLGVNRALFDEQVQVCEFVPDALPTELVAKPPFEATDGER